LLSCSYSFPSFRDLRFGEDFGSHIESVDPIFSKALVRFNPEGDRQVNRRQSTRLRQLSQYLHANNRLFMAELLVPALPGQLEEFDGDQAAFESALRPELVAEAMRVFQEAGIEPDVWTVEGMDRAADWQKVIAVTRRGGRDEVGTLVLGRGEDQTRINQWLATAAAVPGCIGFAVGRLTFWEALLDWRDGRLSTAEAAREIADRYGHWAATFDGARIATAG